MFYVYILQSIVDSSFYIGYTSNLEKRIKQHNSGGSKYTASHLPWKLVYQESYTTKREAIIREKFLKKQKNNDFYSRLINDIK